MDLPTASFDWDGGNVVKCCKHGVTIDEIEMVFRTGPMIAPDIRHSDSELRFIAVGRTLAGRPSFVAFTIRETSGPVSARFMHRKEAKRYEKDRP